MYLKSVREEVEDDLLPQVEVDVDRTWQRLARDDELEAGACRCADAEHARQFTGVKAARSVGTNAGVRAARLDAREIQERVHQFQEPQLVAVDHFQVTAPRSD